MGRLTGYDKAKEMLSDWTKGTITFGELELLIKRNIGTDPRTVSQAMRTMGDLGLIKDIGNTKFKVLR